MNIGVIGGSGFIGSHVVDKLIDEGHSVTVLDIMKPHRDDVVHKTIDITDSTSTSVTLTGGFDVIYLLAAMADVNDCYKNPVSTIELNVLGVANVLDACVKNEIDRFIFASTVYVYSSQGGFYRCSKQASELYIEEYKRVYGLNYTILRFGLRNLNM